MKTGILTAACLLLASTLPATAQSYDGVVQAELLPGWRTENGSHMAAIRISLNPDWKTYWRAPGDAGIPPSFDWHGSGNVAGVEITWPVPEVFDQNGMRSIGYRDEVILPLKVTPKRDGKQVRLKAMMDIGVCRDICVPQRLKVSVKLPLDQTVRDPRIAAAIASRPLSEAEARVGQTACRISTTEDGLRLETRIQLPSTGGREITVVETTDPQVWVAEAETRREGNTLISETEMMHVNGKPFMVDRSGLRFTVLGRDRAVDIRGCTSG